MISFANDYLEGAHPRLLQALVDTNMQQEPGYGYDSFSQQAAKVIKETLDAPEAEVRFLQGGTQTNQIVIDAMLKDYEGVIAPEIGHISVHEAGAIEATGHKVLTLPSYDAKLKPEDIDEFVQTFQNDMNMEHMVFPGMVYITYPTEYGTLYSKKELEELYAVCQKHNLPLYIDGARLGYGLMSEKADLTIQELTKLCDAFYIGGTKIGALCGEAVVFTHNNAPKHFTTVVKRHGGLLAKGRLNGVQFLELFKDGLYFDISKHAVEMSMKLKAGFLAKEYKLFYDSYTNQQFFIMTNEEIDKLKQKVDFACWEKYDDTHSIARFVTNWATKEENVDALLEMI